MDHLKSKPIPRKPGVYIMKDKSGEVIYVGKAIDLRSRVRNYLGAGDGRYQIRYLVQKLDDIEVLVTNSEEEAFVLERDLIQRFKPRYNIRLKDDKAFYHVRINKNDPWPRIELVRKAEHDGALYFGPYTFSGGLRSLLNVIKSVVPLRTCTNTVFYNRTRPCLEYQIKRCAGPCCLPVDPEQYNAWLDQAIALLRGETESTKQYLTQAMELASEELRFEEAANLRDKLEALEKYAGGVPEHSGAGRDVFAFHREAEQASFCILSESGGRIFDTKFFYLSDVELDDESLLEGVISQFYDERPLPHEVVLPVKLENESIILAGLRAKAAEVTIVSPEEGSAKRLLQIAGLNARQSFESYFNKEAEYSETASELSLLCELKQMPRRIEAVDISNLQGTDIVGACVCFLDGTPVKDQYRRYTISNQGEQNDFEAIYEVVKRRLMSSQDLPDLLVIDGGKQQLEMALKAKEETGVEIDIIALAKARTLGGSKEVIRSQERIFLPDSEDSIALKEGSRVFGLLTRLRDEVHRFVLNFHRAKRKKRVMSSQLDSIWGVKPEMKRRLLAALGTIEAIKSASVEEIAKAGRMPKLLAQKIKDNL